MRTGGSVEYQLAIANDHWRRYRSFCCAHRCANRLPPAAHSWHCPILVWLGGLGVPHPGGRSLGVAPLALAIFCLAVLGRLFPWRHFSVSDPIPLVTPLDSRSSDTACYRWVAPCRCCIARCLAFASRRACFPRLAHLGSAPSHWPCSGAPSRGSPNHFGGTKWLTTHSTGPARKAAQSGEFKRS